MKIRDFIRTNFKHFNAAVVAEASQAWVDLLDRGGMMFLAIAGAMSTGELGISLAEMIRQNKVHAICATGANVEEDLFNLIAHSHYRRIPNYRNLSDQQEVELRDQGYNRVTDTCIPEEQAMRRLENHLLELWVEAEKKNSRHFPHEYFYQLIRNGTLRKYYEIDPNNSWVVAAAERNLPLFVPGWEDSTIGNMFVANVVKGLLKSYQTIRTGLEQMESLIHWYLENSKARPIGFFQIGGGIAGDFPICVVPLILQDLRRKCPYWAYFAQISDSTTSYGSYSGAVPNEKITWAKLDIDTPRFIIESDASIVAPLIFHYVLDS